MRFVKMHGLGNDFVVVSDWKEVPANVSRLAMDICDRHFGVGADGLVFLLPSEQADFRMRIFNADGSESEQCGNAIRCLAKLYYEAISREKTDLIVETGRGTQKVWLEVDNDQVKRVRVDMGEPILAAKQIPVAVRVDHGPLVNHSLEVNGKRFSFTAVSMGNPHIVIEVEDPETFPLETWGPVLESHPIFPKRTNVEFVRVHHPQEITMRVWERGVGETHACGSGACAVLVAMVLAGKADRQATIHLKGGDLFIEWNKEDGRVYMTGPAEIVFEGIWKKK
jgi:diaminopimelate epimerase